MDRLHHPTAGGSPPAVDAHATPGYPNNATIFTPWMGHQIIEELRNIVVAAGQTPDKTSVTQVRDSLAFLRGRGVLLSLSAPVTIPNNTETFVAWPTPVYDDAGFWIGGFPTSLTIPAGVQRIRIVCQTTWDNDVAGDRKLRILKNGTVEGIGLPAMRLPSAGSADVTVLNASGGVVAVTPGDYIQLAVFQDCGADLDLRALNTWLHIEAVR